jgi:hypothetical protein
MHPQLTSYGIPRGLCDLVLEAGYDSGVSDEPVTWRDAVPYLPCTLTKYQMQRNSGSEMQCKVGSIYSR